MSNWRFGQNTSVPVVPTLQSQIERLNRENGHLTPQMQKELMQPLARIKSAKRRYHLDSDFLNIQDPETFILNLYCALLHREPIQSEFHQAIQIMNSRTGKKAARLKLVRNIVRGQEYQAAPVTLYGLRWALLKHRLGLIR